MMKRACRPAPPGTRPAAPPTIRRPALVTLAVAAWAAVLGTPAARAQSVTIAVDRGAVTPLAANVSGMNVTSPDSPVDFGDPAVRALVRPLKPAILRWPGGTVSDFFDWRTGLIPPLTDPDPGPIAVERGAFAPYPSIGFNKEIAKAAGIFQPILLAKGGNPLGDAGTGFAGFTRALGGSKFLVVVNAVSNTVDAAERLAFAVARQGLPVAGFELTNEPFFLTVPTSQGTIARPPGAPDVPAAFTDGVDYLTRMKPYDDAIKRGFQSAGVDPGRAVVAIAGGFAADTSTRNLQWMKDLTTYTSAHGAYWDAVAFHFYPPQAKSGGFDAAITYANDALAIGTGPFIQGYRAANFSRGKPLFVSEYGATFNDRTMNGSVYGGLFCAEYVARMSVYPETEDVLLHELFNDTDGIAAPPTAIGGTGNWPADLIAAGQAGHRVDTVGKLKGLYYTAQILGLGLADAAVNASDRAYATRLTGAVGSVPTRTGTLPAVFAQAYHGRDGSLQLIVTNKGASPALAVLVVDGQTAGGPVTVDSVQPTAGDPAQRNSDTAQPIAIRHATARGPITVPGYGVLHLALWVP